VSEPLPADDLCARHVRIGWWSLLFFLSLGAGLEALHSLKLGCYLAPANETRRLLWTLAHAHGTLLAILQLIFGLLTRVTLDPASSQVMLAARCLIGASLLIPGGFLLGGASFHQGDPGLGVLLVPPGALLLFIAVFLSARATR